MCGVATGEEGAPTNMTLFAAYVVRHFEDVSAGFGGSEVKADSYSEERKSGQERNEPVSGTGAVGTEQCLEQGKTSMQPPISGNKESTLLSMEDWQEELFSPMENSNPSHHRFRRASQSSSIETYTSSSNSSSSSPSSSGRLSYDITLEAQTLLGSVPHGGNEGSNRKRGFRPNSKVCAVGHHQFSFFRIIST